MKRRSDLIFSLLELLPFLIVPSLGSLPFLSVPKESADGLPGAVPLVRRSLPTAGTGQQWKLQCG